MAFFPPVPRRSAVPEADCDVEAAVASMRFRAGHHWDDGHRHALAGKLERKHAVQSFSYRVGDRLDGERRRALMLLIFLGVGVGGLAFSCCLLRPQCY